MNKLPTPLIMVGLIASGAIGMKVLNMGEPLADHKTLLEVVEAKLATDEEFKDATYMASAKEMQKLTPFKIDEYTTLVGTTYEPTSDTFNWYYKLTDLAVVQSKPETFETTMRSPMQKVLEVAFCTSLEMATMREGGITAQWVYDIPSAKYLNFTISSRDFDCN